MPAWLETLRVIGTILVWVILPFQVWSTWRTWRQFKRWEVDEQRRLAQWHRDLVDAARLKAEAAQIRAQAEAQTSKAK
jgi:hypothetical protein